MPRTRKLRLILAKAGSVTVAIDMLSNGTRNLDAKAAKGFAKSRKGKPLRSSAKAFASSALNRSPNPKYPLALASHSPRDSPLQLLRLHPSSSTRDRASPRAHRLSSRAHQKAAPNKPEKKRHLASGWNAVDLDRLRLRLRACQSQDYRSRFPVPTRVRRRSWPCAKRAPPAELPALAKLSEATPPCAFQ